MSTFVELEIQNLLNEIEDLDQVADSLVASIESNPEQFTLDNINSLSRFLLKTGRYVQLIQFILRHVENEAFPIPWPYFLEALARSGPMVDTKIVRALIDGIQESNSEGEAARSSALNKYDPKFSEWRSNRKYRIHKDYLNNKSNLLDELITLRTQQLYEQEKNLLHRLQKLYPGDAEIKNEVREYKQRNALEVLSRHIPKGPSIKIDDLNDLELDPETEKALEGILNSLLETAQEMPEMAFDFAIAAFMLDGFETALVILSYSPDSKSLFWLRLELLLRCRRFVELLTELSEVEMALSNDPETFFATAYFRAQALWGLGQKHTAMEVLEGLIAARPHYRAASALHAIWSTK